SPLPILFRLGVERGRRARTSRREQAHDLVLGEVRQAGLPAETIGDLAKPLEVSVRHKLSRRRFGFGAKRGVGLLQARCEILIRDRFEHPQSVSLVNLESPLAEFWIGDLWMHLRVLLVVV